MTQGDLFRAPPPPGPPEVRIVGTKEDCQRFTLANLRDPALSVARYLCPGDAVPSRLVAVWATPREGLPEEFWRALEGAQVADWK